MEARFSPRAKRDLIELTEYVSLEHGPERAQSVKARILAAVRRLARVPGMGHRREDLHPSLRVWTVHRWLILYRPETVPLEIVRVLGGWQDVEALQFEEPES